MDRPQPGARWQFSLHRLLGVIMDIIDHTTLHRGAKYFMDSGRAATLEEAMALLRQFGLAIHVGWEVAHSEAHQVALLTLINITRRTFLGGVAVIGVPDCACTTLLGQQGSLKCAVSALGGTLSTDAPTHWPLALIGTVEPANGSTVIWQLTWEGWRVARYRISLVAASTRAIRCHWRRLWPPLFVRRRHSLTTPAITLWRGGA